MNEDFAYVFTIILSTYHSWDNWDNSRRCSVMQMGNPGLERFLKTFFVKSNLLAYYLCFENIQSCKQRAEISGSGKEEKGRGGEREWVYRNGREEENVGKEAKLSGGK